MLLFLRREAHMNSVALLLATSLLGVDYQITEIDGESVYVVRIEESVARELANGFKIRSTIPSEHSHIRRIQIQVVEDNGVNGSADFKSDNLPRFSPDETVVPESTEISISSEINLEPDAFVLPNLSTIPPNRVNGSPARETLIPLFDSASPEPNSQPFTEEELLSPAPAIVSVREIPAPNREELDVRDPKLSSTANIDIADHQANQRQKAPTSPPDLIKKHQGEFVALASTKHSVKPILNTPANTLKEHSVTPLLLLFFSITLNFFFAFNVFQRYRK